MLTLSVWVAAIMSSPPIAGATNPLKPAEKGLQQCWQSDAVRKTCRVISTYRKTGAETYDNTAQVLISTNGLLTLETHTPVVVRGNEVCATIRTEEIKAGTLRDRGHVVAPPNAVRIVRQIADEMAPFEGKETCTRFERSGNGFIAKVSLAGKYKPELDANVSWVSPSDGYSVKP